MKVLITGGSGNLGRLLMPALVARHIVPVSLDPRITSVPGVQAIPGSILDRACLMKSAEGCDLIVHIAALHGIHESRGEADALDFHDLNVTGTVNVCEAAARCGVRDLVYISSTSVARWPGVYAASKRLAEQVVRDWSARHGLRAISLRPRAFIPPWDTTVYRSPQDWVRRFFRGGVHVGDVVQSVLLAIDWLQAPHPGPLPCVTIDRAPDFTPQELACWSDALPLQRWPHHTDLIGAMGLELGRPPRYEDIAPARALLGYQPTVGLAQVWNALAGPGLSSEADWAQRLSSGG